jgi:hypothetical protein
VSIPVSQVGQERMKPELMLFHMNFHYDHLSPEIEDIKAKKTKEKCKENLSPLKSIKGRVITLLFLGSNTEKSNKNLNSTILCTNIFFANCNYVTMYLSIYLTNYLSIYLYTDMVYIRIPTKEVM